MSEHPVASASADGALPETIRQIIASDGSRGDSESQRHRWASWLIIPILLLAAYLRFTGLNWDNFTHLHPDERFLTMVASSVRTPDSLGQYFSTSTSPLNPYNAGFGTYVYGNFPISVTRFAAETLDPLCRTYLEGCQLYGRSLILTGYDGIHLVGRLLSGVVDLVTILFIFLIGAQLYNRWVGLVAALLLALAVQPIQQSHFFTTDNWSTALVTIAIYAAVRAARANRPIWYALFGLFLGLAVASRINVAPLAIVAVIAAVIWLSRQVEQLAELWSARGFDLLLRAATGVLLAAIVSIVAFRIAMPYAFVDRQMARQSLREERSLALGEPVSLESIGDWDIAVVARTVVGINPQWWANMEEIQRLQQPDAVFPPALQWTNRPPILFPLNNMMFWGMGMMAGMIAWIGVLWGLRRITRAGYQWRAHLIPVSWSLLYFLYMGTRWVKNNRYFLPIYPTLLLLGAWAMVTMWQMAPRGSRARIFAGVMGVMTILFSLMWANAFVDIYREPFTRLQATEWFYENVDSGATLLYEVDGVQQELQLPLRDHIFQIGSPKSLSFEMPQAGRISGVRFNYLTDEQTTPDAPQLRLTLGRQGGSPLMITQTTIDVDRPRAQATINFAPVEVTTDTPLYLDAELVSGGLLLAGTSIIMNEHWDDALPTRSQGRDPFGQYYQGLRDEFDQVDGSVPITAPDSERKRESLLRWLDNSDVIVLSSQRAVWSLPRLARTYPLTTAYYEQLFAGELGFELAAEFHSYLELGPLYVSDTGGVVGWGEPPAVGWPPPPDMTAAEEAFSVYDHPPVWIFSKRDDYSSAQVQTALAAVDLSQALFMNPEQATRTPNALELDAQRFAELQRNGTFRDLFDADSLLNRQPLLAATVFYLLTFALGWLVMPLAQVVFAGLPSQGYGVARILALLLVSYFGWLAASLGWLPNRASTYWLAIVLLAGVSLLLLRFNNRRLRNFVRDNGALLVAVEVTGLLLFALGLIIRYRNPDVWHVIWGGEKPMDLTYLTATLKSVSFPPYDPWYAGGSLNYYYYGFVLIGAPIQLLRLLPVVAYNIVIPLLFSLTGMALFTIAYDLVAWRERRRQASARAVHRSALIAGATAAVVALLLGNLAQLGVVLEYLNADFFYPGNWFWNASRAISVPPGEVGPITEFPYFTFLYGDLHAHMIALPLTMLALAWAIGYGLAGRLTGSDSRALMLLIGALAIGVLYPTNSWDWPTYLVIGLLGIVLHNLRRFGGLTLRSGGDSLWHVAIVGVLSYLLFLPFHSSFAAGFSEIGLWQGATTGLRDYLTIWGLFLLFVLVFLARSVRLWSSRLPVRLLQRLEPFTPLLIGFVALLLIAAIVGLLAGYPVTLIALPLVAIAGLLALSSRLAAADRIVLALIASAFALTLFVDLFVIEGTVGRMNTVFKFYLQVWMLLSVVAGVAFAGVLQSQRNWGSERKLAFYLPLALLVGIALMYPLLATPAKWQTRMSSDAAAGLNGMAFMNAATYEDSGSTVSLAPDYQAVQWMQQHIDGSPVVAEAVSDNYYRAAANRVAMYTGLPTIIGWSGHQAQQRAAVPDARLPQRMEDVRTLYTSPDIGQALAVIDQYDVGYVYVGPLEQLYYTSVGLEKFDLMAQQGLLNVVYQQDGVTIYEVVDLQRATQ